MWGTFLLLAACGTTQTQPPSATSSLGGTSWQLVKFQGGDDKTLLPDDKAKYTITFETDGAVSARIDCNRGRGTWKSSGSSQLQLSPLALTRALCPQELVHDRIVQDWNFVRSYIVKDGRLFLSLMADGGIYEFEPMAGTKSASIESPVASTGAIAFQCTQTGGAAETLNATFYQTQPAMVLVERGERARPAFHVRAASGAKYQGQDLIFSGRAWGSVGNLVGCRAQVQSTLRNQPAHGKNA